MEYYTINIMPRAIYKNDHRKIVERLKKARIALGLGQVEVAKKLGKTQSYLSKIESGLGQVEASKELGKTQSYLSKIESGQRRFDVLQLKEFAKLYKKPLDYFVK